MALLAFTINNNEKQSGKILSNIWKWELRNVVVAYKWETRFGSWRIDSVNFVCKCNFSKFYCFWFLGLLLQKVWLQNSPPIVGDDVYICIESLKYYDKIYDILLWKKKKIHIYCFKISLTIFYKCSAIVLFKGLKIPKIIYIC